MSVVSSRAPGRVNLIGDHTDYNDGFVLPMALPFDTTLTLRSRSDRRVTAVSEGFDSVEFEIGQDPTTVQSWGRYLAGMISRISERYPEVAQGFDAEVSTTIPVGASLSSSAALEMAIGFALLRRAGIEPDPTWVAQCGQWVENEVIGIQSGIMDQLISAAAHDNAALLIDCRTFNYEPVTLPESWRVLIMDTMTRRELADSEYDDRRASCERAAADIGVTKLRDAASADLEKVDADLDVRRARHVITENTRVTDAVTAAAAGDAERFGSLMNDSHESLKSDFEVSSAALDLISGIARSAAGCFGARMTGGGFAGCTVALVDEESVESVSAHVRARYLAETGTAPDLWEVRPSAGAAAAVV